MSSVPSIAALLLLAAWIGFCAWQANRKRDIMDVPMTPWTPLMLLSGIGFVLLLGYVVRTLF